MTGGDPERELLELEVDTSTTIADEWASYRRFVLKLDDFPSGVAEAAEVVFRAAFYAGACAALLLLARTPERELKREIEDYTDSRRPQ